MMGDEELEGPGTGPVSSSLVSDSAAPVESELDEQVNQIIHGPHLLP